MIFQRAIPVLKYFTSVFKFKLKAPTALRDGQPLSVWTAQTLLSSLPPAFWHDVVRKGLASVVLRIFANAKLSQYSLFNNVNTFLKNLNNFLNYVIERWHPYFHIYIEIWVIGFLTTRQWLHVLIQYYEISVTI